MVRAKTLMRMLRSNKANCVNSVHQFGVGTAPLDPDQKRVWNKKNSQEVKDGNDKIQP